MHACTHACIRTYTQVKLISESDTPEYMPPKSLVFGSTPEALDEVVERATSFSCSLGSAMSKVIKPLLSTLPLVPREEQPLLFACENDHAAVKTLKKELEGRVFVVDCMVDRVREGPCNHATMQPYNHATMQPCNHATIQPYNYTCAHACMHLHACMRTCVRAGLHWNRSLALQRRPQSCTCCTAHAHMHTCVPACMHTCMQVCTGREIDEDGVHVQAEPWRGSIVVLEPNLTSRVPFCSKVSH